MSKITLLTGGSKYSNPVRKRLKQNNSTIITLSDSVRGETAVPAVEASKEKHKENEVDIVWNKRSSLSARNSILSILNKFGELNDAVLIYQPGDFNKTFHETSSAVFDLQIDRWIKGYGYLLKEVVQLFFKQQSGRVSFILDTDGMKIMTPLESAIFSFLKSMVQNLSMLYQNEPFKIFCFESDTSKREDFIDFFMKTINETKYTPGKIYRYSDRKSFFDFGKN